MFVPSLYQYEQDFHGVFPWWRWICPIFFLASIRFASAAHRFNPLLSSSSSSIKKKQGKEEGRRNISIFKFDFDFQGQLHHQFSISIFNPFFANQFRFRFSSSSSSLFNFGSGLCLISGSCSFWFDQFLGCICSVRSVFDFWAVLCFILCSMSVMLKKEEKDEEKEEKNYVIMVIYLY